MLTKEGVEAIAKTSGIKVEDLAKAITDEKEVDIKVLVSKTFTESEWESHEDAIDLEKKSKYDEGKTVGTEQTVKKMKQKADLTFDGKKPEDFMEKHKIKMLEEADKNPDSRVKELEGDLKALREVSIPDKDNKIKELIEQIGRESIFRTVEKFIPVKLPESLTREDAKTIIQNEFDFGKDETGEFVKRNGDIMKDDKTRSRTSYQDAISNFVADRKWTVAGGGGGGEDIPGGGGSFSDHKKIRKMTEMDKYLDSKDIHPLSQEAKGLIDDATKAAVEAKEEFVFDD